MGKINCKPDPLVVCAAVRNKLGLVICGARHYDNIMREIMLQTGGREVCRARIH